MKIKSLLVLFSFFTFLAFISCDDDLNEIGSSIQPPSDTISVVTDTIPITARTISMFDSVYARTTRAVLGKYEDDLFGSIKSDYLCQFYFPESSTLFKDQIKSIDSSFIHISYSGFSGDSLSPMGLTVYKVTSTLPEYFYTNIDPTKYADMNQVLANEAYTIAGNQNSQVKAKFDMDLAKQIYEGWKDKTITDNASFQKFFPGIYVTTNLGSNNLLQTSNTRLSIYYTYSYKDTTGVTRDTTGVSVIANTEEVLQLNHLKNTNPEHLFQEGTGQAYLKTPAGVYTEIEIPVEKIVENMEKNKVSAINSVQFILKGYTEKEPSTTEYDLLQRPSRLLLIHKDSVDVFFKERKLPYPNSTSKLSYLSNARSTSNNTYSFDNLSRLITECVKQDMKTASFVLIPVETEYIYNSSTSSYDMVGVYHSMSPAFAILRNDSDNLRFELIYSKF
ncbi:MAG: DUF4270 domain-containing protein [Dysgonomonas sp.]|nr:DUF4270 domain-containing protein [Dysgonomonas sp.]